MDKKAKSKQMMNIVDRLKRYGEFDVSYMFIRMLSWASTLPLLPLDLQYWVNMSTWTMPYAHCRLLSLATTLFSTNQLKSGRWWIACFPGTARGFP